MKINIGVEEITIEAKVISADGTVRDLGIVGNYKDPDLSTEDLQQLTSLAEDLTLKGN